MKTVITIIAVFGITVAFIACSPKKLSTTEISVLTDSTDTFITYPKADEVLNLFGVSNLWAGRIFRQSYISDVSINASKEVRIDAQNSWNENQFLRENKIKRFKSDVTEILKQVENTPRGKNNSAVYYVLARELNRLSESKSDKRILLVFSDMLEHTPEMSFYDSKQFVMLEAMPEEIAKDFEKQVSLNSLTGIEVWIVYQPDRQNDKRFRVASGFYKKLLESKGAKVTITANLYQ